jgi:phage shock protein A
VEPTDLTVAILKEIREDIRGLRDDNRALRADFQLFAEQSAARFEAIETTLRDLAQQMVMLARGVKSALEHRGASESRIDDLEARVRELEKRAG